MPCRDGRVGVSEILGGDNVNTARSASPYPILLSARHPCPSASTALSFCSVEKSPRTCAPTRASEHSTLRASYYSVHMGRRRLGHPCRQHLHHHFTITAAPASAGVPQLRGEPSVRDKQVVRQNDQTACWATSACKAQQQQKPVPPKPSWLAAS